MVDGAVAMDVTPSGPAPSAPGAPDGQFQHQLKWYYSRLFPYEQYYRWLSYGNGNYFSRREVSFTLASNTYLRYRSFSNAEELLGSLKDRVPVKIDIGAVYNLSPKERALHGATLVPLEKELVFDIDMTDYEDIMGDLKDGSAFEVCDKNWAYMSAAVKVVSRALREDFGFKHLLWVFSGRRGIHCWVADQKARRLSNETRSAIVKYLSIQMISAENASSGKKVDEITNPLHPALAKAKRQVCEPLFREFVLEDQGMLSTPERVSQMLSFVHDSRTRETLQNRLSTGAASRLEGTEKWEKIKQELIKARENTSLDYIIFHYTYPRLDVNVSKDVGHLLKGPFCVHPGTGRVCVPFLESDPDSFRPERDAPHIGLLINDANSIAKGNPEGEATSALKKGVSVFEDFVHNLERENARIAKATRTAKLKELDHRNAAEFLAF